MKGGANGAVAAAIFLEEPVHLQPKSHKLLKAKAIARFGENYRGLKFIMQDLVHGRGRVNRPTDFTVVMGDDVFFKFD